MGIADKDIDVALGKQGDKPPAVVKAERMGMEAGRKDMRRVSQKLIDALASEFEPSELADELRNMLSAVVVSKGGTERPDTRTRMEAIKLILAYVVGTPVQRQEQVNYNLDINDLTEADLVELMKKSPTTIRKMEKMLAEAKGEPKE